MTSPVPPINPGNRDYRIGDDERQQAMDALGKHFTAGRLDVTEYDNRLAIITNAVMQSDLAEVFSDLPPLTPTGTPPMVAQPPNTDYANYAAAYSETTNKVKLNKILIILPLIMVGSLFASSIFYMLGFLFFLLFPVLCIAGIVSLVKYVSDSPEQPQYPQQPQPPQAITPQQYQQIQITQQQVTIDPYTQQQMHHRATTRWRYNNRQY